MRDSSQHILAPQSSTTHVISVGAETGSGTVDGKTK